MRLDHIVTINKNLESQALFMEQVASMKETEAARLRAGAKALRSLASEEALPDDPPMDLQPFQLPSVAKPRTGDDTRRDYSRQGSLAGGGTGTLQNGSDGKGEAA